VFEYVLCGGDIYLFKCVSGGQEEKRKKELEVLVLSNIK